MDDFEQLENDADTLGDVAAQSAEITRVFATELRALGDAASGASGSVTKLERGFSGGINRAIDDVVLDGGRLSDALSSVAQSVARTGYGAAVKPVANHFGGLLADGVGSLFSGLTGGAGASKVMAFAKGGIVGSPTSFPMAQGTGLMGEAGPEAIMPLTRTADGRLGVVSHGGGSSVNVTVNVSTPDVAGFQRSRSQIAAQMARAIGQSQRNR